MANNLNLEVLKAHLFETLEGVKNQNDEQASPCEKVSIEQAKAIVDVADSIIDIYKLQVEAFKVVSGMDHLGNPEQMLVGMGVTGAEEMKLIQ